jgi:hypothetical protein
LAAAKPSGIGEGTMAELPDLLESKRRELELLWTDIVGEHRFTGEHLWWHESPEKQRKAAEPINDVRPSEPPPIDDVLPRGVPSIGVQGGEISYGLPTRGRSSWVAIESRRTLAERECDPTVIDSIGVTETTDLAQAGFHSFADACFVAWSQKPGSEYEEFCVSLAGIATYMDKKIGELWEPRWNWYTRVCSAKVKDALASDTKDWKEKARNWLQRRARLLGTSEFEESVKGGMKAVGRDRPPSDALEGQPPPPTEASFVDTQRQFHEEISPQIRGLDGSMQRTTASPLDQLGAIKNAVERPAQQAENESETTEDQLKPTGRAADVRERQGKPSTVAVNADEAVGGVESGAKASPPNSPEGAEYLLVLRAAIDDLGLTIPKLAREIQRILRGTVPKGPKADRTTIYRIMDGSTKRPQPAVRNALIKALGLEGDEALIALRALGASGSDLQLVKSRKS